MAKSPWLWRLVSCMLLACLATGALRAGESAQRMLSLAALLALIWADRPRDKRAWLARGLATLSGAALLWTLDALAGAAALCLACAALADARDDETAEARLAGALLLFAATGFLQYTRWGYQVLEGLAGMQSALGGALLNRTLRLGPSYTGAGLLVAFGAMEAGPLLRGGFRKPGALLAMLASAVLGCAYVAVWSLLSETNLYAGLAWLEPLLSPFDYRPLLFALLLPPASFLYRPLPRTGGERRWDKPLPFTLAFAALSLAAALLIGLSLRAPGAAEPGLVAIYNPKGEPIALSKPEEGSYGLANAGMFGMLEPYLRAMGHEVVYVEALDKESLAGAEALVIVNLMRSIPEAERAAVWDFVADGRTLMLLGDHTGGEQIRLPSNELLSPVGIRLNFDSAIPFRDLWTSSYSPARHPVYARATSVDIQINIGASLEIDSPARAVLVGRDGYADRGDEANVADGQLGNMHFERGERLGDLILVAEAAYGRGKALVYGDTSPLQPINLAYGYDTVSALFRYLLQEGTRPVWLEGLAALALVLAALAVGGSVSARRGMAVAAGAAAAVCLAVWLPGGAAGDFSGDKVLVDGTDCAFVQNDRGDNAADGLLESVERAGYLPYFARDALKIDADAAAMILLAPSAPLDEAKVDELIAYLEGGGTLILSAGYRERAGIAPLIGRLGLSVGDTPLGRGETERAEKRINPWEAWPIEGATGEVLAEEWGYPVAVAEPVGAGTLIWIADGQFFLSKNLESTEGYDEKNVAFFAFLAETYFGAKEGAA